MRSGATFEVAHIRTFVGHDQRSLKLTRSCRIDTEVGAQLHRATHALRDIAERSVREYRCVQRREEVIGIGHHATQVLAHQFGVVAYCLADRAEDDTLLGQHLLEGCLDRNRVHHRIDCHARQRHLLFERNTQLVERATQLRVDFVHRVELGFCARCGVIDYVLVIDFGNIEVGPRWHSHREPMVVGFKTICCKPLRFTFFLRDESHDIFVQTARNCFGLDVGGESVFVFVAEVGNYLISFFHL